MHRYIPILPMILVNGADGIGTGWATKIPNYNPRDIVDNLLRMLEGQEPKEMVPWFKNFRGTITKLGHQKYLCNGELSRVGPDRIEITELPVRIWTTTYKEEIEKMMTGGEIQDFEDYSTDDKVGIVVKMDKEKLRKAKEEKGLHVFFKLQTTMSTTSMVIFDHMGCIRTYETVQDILAEFFELRLDLYGKRKAFMEMMMAAEASKLSNQVRFISEMCSGELKFEKQEKQGIVEDLTRRKYESDPVKAWKESQDVDEWCASNKSGSPDFDYLMSMPLWNFLTQEKMEELGKERDKKEQELADLKATSKEELWRFELQEFLAKLDEVEEGERRDYDEGSGRGEWSLKVPKVLVSSKSHLEISEETKMLMKERDIAETRKKRTKCTKDIQYWKRLRNRVVTMVRKANKAAVHDLMEESETPCEAKLVTADALPSKNAVRVEPKVCVL